MVLDDGTELPADLVVYATGYGSMNQWLVDLVSQEVADRVGKAWNDADTAAREVVGDKVDFYEAPAPVVDALRKAATELEAKWAASLPQGRDGAAALAEFRQMTGVAQQ